MNELQRASFSHIIGRGLARAGIVALAAATISGVGASGALAQENEGIYGGGMAVGNDTGEAAPVAEEIVSVPAPEVPSVEIPVPGAVTTVMDAEELPAPVDLGVVGPEMPGPVDLGVLGEGIPSPVDISAIFAGLNLPAPVAGETETESTIGPEISVGATPGGDASGTITMGGSEGSGITMGGETGGASGG